jgi:hypothetical protein
VWVLTPVHAIFVSAPYASFELKILTSYFYVRPNIDMRDSYSAYPLSFGSACPPTTKWCVLQHGQQSIHPLLSLRSSPTTHTDCPLGSTFRYPLTILRQLNSFRLVRCSLLKMWCRYMSPPLMMIQRLSHFRIGSTVVTLRIR